MGAACAITLGGSERGVESAPLRYVEGGIPPPRGGEGPAACDWAGFRVFGQVYSGNGCEPSRGNLGVQL